MKMRKFFFTLSFIFSAIICYSQNYDSTIRWNVTDDILEFPPNFPDWIKRNIGPTFYPFNKETSNREFGDVVQTDQTYHSIDFNGDGKKDFALELNFRGYMTDSILTQRYQFYKAIFLSQNNGKYLLDTNWIITGRGYENGGEFGDFNGDGKLDYINICGNYHGKQEWKPLDLFKYPNDVTPSQIYLNNGKGFDEIIVDTTYMGASEVYVSDLDNDKVDDFVLALGENMIWYKYDVKEKKINRTILNVNRKINEAYPRKISFLVKPMLNRTNVLAIIAHGDLFNPNSVSDLDIIKIDLVSDNFTVLNKLKQATYRWPDGQFSTNGIYPGPHSKYIDLDNDQKEEFIITGGFGRMINNGTKYYGERMGINVFSGNENVTDKFYEIDTLDNMIKGYFGVIKNNNIIIPFENGINADIQVDSLTFKKYTNIYFKLLNGKFRKHSMVFDSKHANMPFSFYRYYPGDFNNDGNTDLLVSNPDDLRKAKLYTLTICNPPKPSFNTNNFTFCSADSLKLTITNVNKGDTLKWYYGSKSDLTNVSSKTFTGSSKVFVTRTDSLGCNISSDTIQVSVLERPSKPTISWNGNELSIASTYSGYQWLFNDSTITGATANQHKPINPGNYKIRVSNTNQCTETSTAFTIVVTALSNPSFEGKTIKVFPNPTSSYCTLDLGQQPQKAVSIKLYNSNGVEVGSWSSKQRVTKIGLENLPNGNYILEISNAKNKITTSIIKN